MKKTGIALAALAALSVAAVSPADARPRGHYYHGPGPGPALFGLAAGAIIAGAAAASQPRYYDYGPGYYYGSGPYNYYGGPVYYGRQSNGYRRHYRHW